MIFVRNLKKITGSFYIKAIDAYIKNRPAQLSTSEIIFIAIWYKCSHFNNFKALDKAGLESLTIKAIDNKTRLPVQYYWKSGIGMTSIKKVK